MDWAASNLNSLYDLVCRGLDALLPFSWISPAFMKTPFLMMLILCPTAAAVGTVAVNARMSFFTEALSHSAFTGVALGIMMGLHPTLIMFAFGCAVALAITFLRRNATVSMDTAVGVMLSLSVALGVVVITATKFRNADRFLFGDVLLTEKSDLGMALLLAVIVFGFLALTYNRLLMIGLDARLARAWGVNTFIYEYLFSLLVAVVVMMSVASAGVLLVTALIIVPAAAGRSLARGAGSMFWCSVAVSLVAGVGGFIASFYLNSATGGTIVLAAGAIFGISVIYRAIRG
ncbi:MAG: metal ABC transporter permease [Candidatus Brocadiia bacterium]